LNLRLYSIGLTSLLQVVVTASSRPSGLLVDEFLLTLQEKLVLLLLLHDFVILTQLILKLCLFLRIERVCCTRVCHIGIDILLLCLD
jgi:hypothetical protein